jgi:hypothetical protein
MLVGSSNCGHALSERLSHTTSSQAPLRRLSGSGPECIGLSPMLSAALGFKSAPFKAGRTWGIVVFLIEGLRGCWMRGIEGLRTHEPRRTRQPSPVLLWLYGQSKIWTPAGPRGSRLQNRGCSGAYSGQRIRGGILYGPRSVHRFEPAAISDRCN